MKTWNVYFSDDPFEPATFRGTKAAAIAAAKLYIKQWQLDATIIKMEEVN
jgi:hypothetical protein